ncbi:major royal jelly protein, putative, partial [Bodo saltans]
IFPFNSSFLNDIRVDSTGTRAYMTDTNLAGNGAVVVLDISSGYVRRVSNPTMLIQPGYVVDVGGALFPSVQAPSDGIGLAPDGSALYYSVITGSHLFRVPTDMLFDASVTDDAIFAATTILFNKSTSSDGMDVVDVTDLSDESAPPTWAAIYGDFVHDALALLTFGSQQQSVVTGEEGNTIGTLTQSQQRMEWVDTIVADKNPQDMQGSIVVYFTSNRLPRYVTWSMDFSGGRGSNMRVWKMVVPRASSPRSPKSSNNAPTWTVAVMATLAALLAALIAFYWVVRRAKVNRPETSFLIHETEKPV